MKKFILISVLLLISNISFAFEIPKGKELLEYVDKPYIGMPYYQGFNEELPYILILANPTNAFMLTRLAPIAEMAYEEFKGQYNFGIYNTKIEENKILVEFFAPKKLPALYLIDPKEKTYTYIERKYYNKKDIRKILTEFGN